MGLLSILVVDDDEPFRSRVCRALRRQGHRVREAHDGSQALRLVREAPPTILVTDILMPGRDGLELITAIKDAFPNIHILVMSGRSHLGKLDLLRLASMLGANGAFQKFSALEGITTAIEKLSSAQKSVDST